MPPFRLLTAALVLHLLLPAHADPPPLVTGVDAQPLIAQTHRLLEALDLLGAPLPKPAQDALTAAFASPDPALAIQKIQEILDPHCLFSIDINPESRVKVAVGPARPELIEQGWKVFLVKIQNEAGVTAELKAVSPNARSVFVVNGKQRDSVSDQFFRAAGQAQADPNPADRWLDLSMFNAQPLRSTLSGLVLEYRLIELYSRDAGQREAKIAFNVGQGTQDLGFRNDADLLFTCRPSTPVTFRVHDEDGKPTTASFIIRDRQGRVYPSQFKRLAPDFAFQPQIYRADGEKIDLPPGEYTVEFSRGPEYLTETRTLVVTETPRNAEFLLHRWIDPSKLGWWSGDHHIHAAGCAHYVKPTEGVLAPDMMRHCLGEDVKVGCNLTWGPCFDFQKQFFTGADDRVSHYPYLLHYDIEVSGFGSHKSGHLCLLRLKEQIPPGGDSDTHWPTLCLNTLRWAKKQGAVVGPAHSGWGLEVASKELPNYIVPPYNGIGANEYIVDVTHEVPGPDGKLVPAVDFMSAADTPVTWELNMWYHTLNAGFRTRISGETDFPCIYGERVGLGRSYVKLDGELTYDQWCEGIRRGRNYVSDGRSHLMDFTLQPETGPALHMGENGSELSVAQPGAVHLHVRAAAYLDEKPNPAFQNLPSDQKPYWNTERARIGSSRNVLVEVIVNGYPAGAQPLLADGQIRDLEFPVTIARSSWVAVRILASSHTNPIFILVGNKPIRASRRSLDWCLKGVDQCWSQKRPFIDIAELPQAEQDYQHARETYRARLAECDVD